MRVAAASRVAASPGPVLRLPTVIQPSARVSAAAGQFLRRYASEAKTVFDWQDPLNLNGEELAYVI